MAHTRNGHPTGMPPLSPYLCLIVMNVMSHDVNHGRKGTEKFRPMRGRVRGNSARRRHGDNLQKRKVINETLNRIETEGKNIGLNLNRGKCENYRWGKKQV